MAQETASVNSSKLARPIAIDWKRGGLRWKISLTFTGLILGLGVLVIGIVYYFTSRALQNQVDLRAEAIATNLADAGAGLVSRKGILELDVELCTLPELGEVEQSNSFWSYQQRCPEEGVACDSPSRMIRTNRLVQKFFPTQCIERRMVRDSLQCD